jgi:STE24 endopeptidase
LVLLVTAGVFALLYLWFTLFPGRAVPGAGRYFTTDQVERGREYQRGLRLVSTGSFLVQAFFLAWLVFGGRAAVLSTWALELTGSYWGGVLLFFFVLWLALRVLNLPFRIFSSYCWQRRWGFSTQTFRAWWIDYLKGAAIDLILSAAGAVLFFWVAARWPAAWWLAGAALFFVLYIFLVFIWPLVVAPLFNRFEPAADPAVVGMVRELAQKAGLPVEQVLVMDASRRTTRANAYFTGLGRTKRIVLYDTLLRNYPLEQVRAVVAHEMAHWCRGHVMRGLALGVMGSFVIWGLLFVALRGTIPVSAPYPPHAWAVVLLFATLGFFVSSPLQNFISRRMEEEADRVAVQLTGDAAAAVRLQVELAAKNLSDVSPPAFIRWFSYSHPPVLERIGVVRKAGKAT